jgi:FMN-dependent NADH-azoreductase
MSKVLYIQASPRGKRSHCITVADRFLQEYRQRNPKDEIIILNVFTRLLPSFDGTAVQAKYSIMRGKPHTADEAEAWKVVEKEIDLFKSAEKYIFAVPMWNFSIPYRLKLYIDILVQPTYTFTMDEKGAYKGLLTGRKAFVAYASGGQYPAGPMAAYDHQKPYLELILGFMGITDVRSVRAEGTLAGPEVAEKSQAEALETAARLAEGF